MSFFPPKSNLASTSLSTDSPKRESNRGLSSICLSTPAALTFSLIDYMQSRYLPVPVEREMMLAKRRRMEMSEPALAIVLLTLLVPERN